MSTLKVAAINNPSASSGGLAISASGNVTGAGLDLITTQSFSAVSSVSVNSCFSATYDNYRIILVDTGNGASRNLRLRSAGADNTTSNYNSSLFYVTYAAASGAQGTVASGTFATIGFGGSVGSLAAAFCLDIIDPSNSKPTFGCGLNANTNLQQTLGFYFAATTAFDGFTIYAGSGSITGTVAVYGYRK